MYIKQVCRLVDVSTRTMQQIVNPATGNNILPEGATFVTLCR